MKKVWVYLLGVLTGVILTFIVSLVLLKTSSDSAYTYFKEPGDVMDARSYTVFQAGDGEALAYEHILSDVVVLLWNKEGRPYYDGQTVAPQKGECFRQVGIYKYTSKDGNDRTVPIVAVMEGGGYDSEAAIIADPNFVFFGSPGQVMPDKGYRVTRILNDSCVLAKGKQDNYDDDYWFGLEVLILDHNASTYYTNQIIKTSGNKRFKQIGTYKTDDFFETVIPIVKLMN